MVIVDENMEMFNKTACSDFWIGDFHRVTQHADFVIEVANSTNGMFAVIITSYERGVRIVKRLEKDCVLDYIGRATGAKFPRQWWEYSHHCRYVNASGIMNSEERMRLIKPMFVYFIYDSINNTVKIGVSKSPSERIKQLSTSASAKLQLLCVVEGDANKEKELHSMFADDRLNGEWFTYSEAIQQYIASHQGG